MPNIATLLKSEITRLARKEIRGEVSMLKKASASHRRHIASLKRKISELERQVRHASRRQPAAADQESSSPKNRFSAKGLKSLRSRLGVSAADFAKLLGASMQSVYNWEHGKTTPRPAQVASIAALRSIGRREANQRLEATREDKKAARSRKKG